MEGTFILFNLFSKKYKRGTFEVRSGVRLRFVEGTFTVFNLFSLKKYKGDKFELPLRYV